MAVTEFGTNHTLAVKLWSRRLLREALKTCYFDKFMGEDDNALIQIVPDLEKQAGDNVTYGLRMQLQGAGVQGDATLEGNEEALTFYSDSVTINQLRHAVRSAGKMSEQRVPYKMREEARRGLSDWFADRLDTSLFNHLAGFAMQNDTRYTGNNTVLAPSTGKIIYGAIGNAATTEGSVGSDSASNIFRLIMLDTALELAKTANPPIRPVKTDGGDYYVCFLHTRQVTDLRAAAQSITGVTASVNWFDLHKSALMGGMIKDNPIFTGALGIYNNVVLHESVRVPCGYSTSTSITNVRRAIFCGAQAAVVAFGQATPGSSVSWKEDMFDYGNQLGVAGGLVFGVKKTRFNSADFATIVISTAGGAHA